MKIYFDTEFTDLWNAQPISFGFAASNGDSLYVEVPFNRKACSPFVEKVVVPLLDGLPRHKMNRNAARFQITTWLARHAPAELICDFIGDYWMLREIIPHEVVKQYVTPRCARGFDPSLEEWTKRGLRQHHALHDALVLCALDPTLQVE